MPAHDLTGDYHFPTADSPTATGGVPHTVDSSQESTGSPLGSDPGITAPSTPRTAPDCPTAVPAPPGFEVIGELGRGGMGVVYHARQVRLNRPVALKVILAGAHADRASRARFLAEAEAVAAVHHPHVIQVYDAGEHDGLPYLAMEFAPGGCLRKKLAGGPLSPADAARLVGMLAEGVAAAHDVGIVHRDLKPANVLFDAAGSPKVADFGLAKRVGDDALTATGSILGSPSYMAPEQAAGRTREIGPPTDVYALGAILYECLTGKPPFRGESVIETMDHVRSRAPTPPRRTRPEIPKALEAVCLRCLAKRPVERYPSARSLAADLDAFAAGTLRVPVGRRRLAVGLATLALAAVAAAIIATLPRGGRPEPQPTASAEAPGETQPPAEGVAAVKEPTVEGDQLAINLPRRIDEIDPVGLHSSPGALIVAGSQQKHLAAGCAIDALHLGAALQPWYRERVATLADYLGPKSVPTAANIRRVLSHVVRSATPTDTFILTLSGNGFETETGHAHFLATDSELLAKSENFISEFEIGRELENSKARVNLVLWDACRIWHDLKGSSPPIDEWKRVRNYAVFYGSCSGGACYSDDVHGGYFSHIFTRAIQGTPAAADANRDGSITLKELSDYVIRETPVLQKSVLEKTNQPRDEQIPEVKTNLPPDTVLFGPVVKPPASR